MIYDDICELNSIDNQKNSQCIGIKNYGNKIKLEYQNIEEPNKLYSKKKKDMEDEKLQYNKDYLDFCSFSKRLYVESVGSKSPLDIFLIGPKIQIQEQLQENDKNNITNLKNEEFDDKFIDIMKGNNIYLNENHNFRKDSFNSELSFFDKSQINI